MTKSEKQTKLAIAAYRNCNEETKKVLEQIFGTGAFPKPKAIEDMNFEDILEVSKPSKEVLAIIHYTGDDETMQGLSALASLEQVTKVYNEGKVIDWTNGKSKYFVWADMRTASGAGFSLSLFDLWYTYSFCGSRLCFLDQDRCLLAKEKFAPLYAKLFCIRNQVPNIYVKKA